MQRESDYVRALLMRKAQSQKVDRAALSGALQKLDERGVCTESTRVIARAIETGRKRLARTIEIIVHPAEPFELASDMLGKHLIAAKYAPEVAAAIEHHLQCYEHEMLKIIKHSKDPVFIESGLPTYLTTTSPLHGDPIRSCVSLVSRQDRSKATGYLNEAQFERLLMLTNGIHDDDRILLHGAYAGACVSHLALQLSVARLLGRYFIDASFEDPHEHSLSYAEATAFKQAWTSNRLFHNSNIRMGTVFDRYNVRLQPLLMKHLVQLTEFNAKVTRFIPNLTPQPEEE